jgi:hypothetical protein
MNADIEVIFENNQPVHLQGVANGVSRQSSKKPKP